MSSKKHKFYILRHGETDANVSGKIQGSSDFSRLTENGKEQARLLGAALVNTLEISNGVYVSPLSRSRDTLSIIRAVHEKFGKNEVILDCLREIDFYDWEGKREDEIIAEYPESWEAWKRGDANNLVVLDKSNPGQCSERYPLHELWTRAEEVWKIIHQLEEEEYTYKYQAAEDTEVTDVTTRSSILVCHGTLGQALLGTSFAKDVSFFGKNTFPNCGMLEIEWDMKEVAGKHKFYEKATKWKWFS